MASELSGPGVYRCGPGVYRKDNTLFRLGPGIHCLGPVFADLGRMVRTMARAFAQNSQSLSPQSFEGRLAHSLGLYSVAIRSLGVALALGMSIQGCSPQNSNHPTDGAAIGGAPASGNGGSGGSGAAERGTGDSTGGNGLQGRVFESYLIPNVTELPEWKQHVDPICARLAELEKADAVVSQATPETGSAIEQSATGGADLEKKKNECTLKVVAQRLKWYLVPAQQQLPKVPAETLGVDFFGDSVQQIALQSWGGEVWIDASVAKGPNSTSESFAKLIVHEIAVRLYLLKFLEFKEAGAWLTTDLSERAKLETADPLVEHMYRTAYAPEPKRPLTEVDYKNIRGATHLLLNRLAPLQNLAELLNILRIDYQFDQRLFRTTPQFGADNQDAGGQTSNGINPQAVSDETVVETRPLLRAIANSFISGSGPKYCYTAVRTEPQPNTACQITSQLVDRGQLGELGVRLMIDVGLKGQQKKIAFEMSALGPLTEEPEQTLFMGPAYDTAAIGLREGGGVSVIDSAPDRLRNYNFSKKFAILGPFVGFEVSQNLAPKPDSEGLSRGTEAYLLTISLDPKTLQIVELRVLPLVLTSDAYPVRQIVTSNGALKQDRTAAVQFAASMQFRKDPGATFVVTNVQPTESVFNTLWMHSDALMTGSGSEWSNFPFRVHATGFFEN